MSSKINTQHLKCPQTCHPTTQNLFATLQLGNTNQCLAHSLMFNLSFEC